MFDFEIVLNSKHFKFFIKKDDGQVLCLLVQCDITHHQIYHATTSFILLRVLGIFPRYGESMVSSIHPTGCPCLIKPKTKSWDFRHTCLTMILFLPVQVNAPANQNIGSVGGNGTVQLGVKGFPRSTYLWRKDSKELDIKNSRYSIARDGSLTIINLKPSDAGIYTCTIHQLFGKKSQTVSIKVSVKPAGEYYFILPPNYDFFKKQNYKGLQIAAINTVQKRGIYIQ